MVRQTAGLSDSELALLRDQGFLLIEGLLDPAADLDPILAEYEGVLDQLANELHAEGALDSTYADLPFAERLVTVYRETGRTFAQHFDFTLPQQGIAADTPMWLGPAVFAALTHPRLLDIAESVIGPELYSNPVQHVRIKPPLAALASATDGGALVHKTAWHQDNGVLLPTADQTDMVTVWFSLTDAPVESGCLQVIPGSHRDGLHTHSVGAYGPQIADSDLKLDRAQPVPTRRGDVLLLDKRTCHGSLPNVSDQVRCSFDIRYSRTGQPTGRDQFPGFVARSRRDPASVLTDPEEWAALWYSARAQLAAATEPPVFNRWG